MWDSSTRVELGKDKKRDRELVRAKLQYRDECKAALRRVKQGDVVEEIDLDSEFADISMPLVFDDDEKTREIRRIFFRELAKTQGNSIPLKIHVATYHVDQLECAAFIPRIQEMVAEWSALYTNLSPTLAFRCNNYGDEFGDMSLPALAARLNQITTIPLKSLSFERIHFPGYDDFEAFGAALSRHARLTKLDFDECQFHVHLSALAMAFSKAPNLQSLYYRTRSGSGYFDRQRITLLVANMNNVSRLKTLDLPIVPLELDLGELFETMQQSRTIQKLCMSSNSSEVETKNVHHVARMLENNNTCLEIFNLQYYFAGALSFEPVALALRSNTKLRKLHLGKVHIHISDVVVFLSALENDNYALESLIFRLASVCPHTQENLDRIEFLLKLNRDCQRKRLLAPDAISTDDDWIEAIVNCKDDVSVTFYYLSKRPSILKTKDYFRIESLGRIQTAKTPETICKELHNLINDQHKFGSILCESFYTSNGMDLVLKCMQDYPSKDAILEHGFGVFNILLTETTHKAGILAVVPFLYSDRLLQVAMRALIDHQDNERLLKTVLHHLSKTLDPTTPANTAIVENCGLVTEKSGSLSDPFGSRFDTYFRALEASQVLARL